MTELTSNTLLKAYRDRSYFGATIKPPVATLGAAGQCQGALVTVRVEEGPPYQMGQFSVEGLPELAASLTKKWKLKTGAPFVASYPAEFQQKVLAGLKHNGRPLVLMTTENHTVHVVDVIVGLKR
jgi:outer membrane protein assembly factor BamA